MNDLPQLWRMSYVAQLQYYSQLRSTMNTFRASIKAQLSRLERGAKTDLLRKYACLVAFDFEAAAQLGMWTSFGGLVEVCSGKLCGNLTKVGKETEICGDPKIYNVIVDIILTCEAPTEGKVSSCRFRKSWLTDYSRHSHIASQELSRDHSRTPG